VKDRSEKIKLDTEEKRRLKKVAGLHLCDVKCPETGAYCQIICLEQKGLKLHEEKAKHAFPATNARDWLLREASKAGGAIANGSRPNRRTHTLFEQIIPATSGSEHELEAQCYQRFNRQEKIESQQKTDAQLWFLLDCYDAPNKQNENQTHEQMKITTDERDGGLKFCSSKSKLQINGCLLTKEQICSWNSCETTRRAKGKVSGEERMKSLKNHLQVIKKYKDKNSQYWKIIDDKGKSILKGKPLVAIAYLFEVNGVNVDEKRKKLDALNLTQSKVDTMISMVSQRIDNFDHRIKRAKNASFDSGRRRDAGVHQDRLQLERNLVLDCQNSQNS